MADEQVIPGSETPTQVILPKSEFNPIDPVNGAIYDDDLYAAQEAKKAGGTAPSVTNTPTQQADEPAGVKPAPATTDAEGTDKPQFDFDTVLKEKTGGKFEKWDDIQKRLDNSMAFENETSKTVADYIASEKFEELGLYLNQRQILAGIEDMEGEKAIKLQMRIDDPDATPEDIEDDFREKYGDKPDPDVLDEADYRKAIRKYNKQVNQDAETSKASLLKLKESVKLTPLAQQKAEGLTREDIDAESAEYSKAIATSVEASLTEFNSVPFVFEDKDKGILFNHDYALTDQDKADLKASVADYFEHFETTYKTNGGEFDGKKLAQDMFITRNWEKIMKSAVTNAYNQGLKQTQDQIANVNLTQQSNPAIDFAADKYQKAAEAYIEA